MDLQNVARPTVTLHPAIVSTMATFRTKARVGRTNLFGVGLASVKSGSVVIA